MDLISERNFELLKSFLASLEHQVAQLLVGGLLVEVVHHFDQANLLVLAFLKPKGAPQSELLRDVE